MKTTNLFVFALISALLGNTTVGQNKPKIDSLQAVLLTQKADSGMVNTLNALSWEQITTGDYGQALDNAQKAKAISEKIGYQNGLAGAYRRIGGIYYSKGNYPLSLEFCLKAVKIFEVTKSQEIFPVYNNIGNIYCIKQDFDKAIEYYFKSSERKGDKSSVYLNIGVAYCDKTDYLLSLEYLSKSLKICNEMDNKENTIRVMNAIGTVNERKNNYSEAIKWYQESMGIAKEISNIPSMIGSLGSISNIFLAQKKYNESILMSNRALKLAKEIGDIYEVKEAEYNISKAYQELHRADSSLVHFQRYESAKDSLFNEESTSKIVRSEMNFDFEKKQAIEKAEQEKRDAVHAQELKTQQAQRNSFILGFILILIFSIFLFKSFRSTKKEKQRSEKLLLNILPEETANELKLNGYVEPKQIDLATVMFTDFKGFTQIAETMSAKELVAELDYCFKGFDAIISKHNIEKIKTIGDSYMCVGGIPSENTTHPQDVVMAALEIQKFMAEYSKMKASQGKKAWDIRIGIHTGPVVAGVVGTTKFSYDIWGDTVNTASRMESSGEANQINLSQTTYRFVKEKFDCIYRGEIEAKNKGKLKMYFVKK